MTIREAGVKDIEALSAIRLAVKENVLHNPALVTHKDYVDYLTVHGKGWLAEIYGVIAGFAIAGLEHNNIWALFVHPDFEKNGVGKQLHHTMMNWYFSQTDKPVWLTTAPGTRADAFYRKAGWKDVGMSGNEVKFELRFSEWENVR
jgi:GNAT superfamily N-acetyltransferase